MSRSNPNEHAPNPAVRWFEWNGEHGVVRYYDKDEKKNVDVPLPFSFLLLDELASVRGWHDASESGIYSNEVRDTRTDILVVKSFKGGTLAEGIYKEIKDRVNTLGGQFVANLYIAVADDTEPGDPQYQIASLRFKGSALGSWMEFRKACRSALYEKAIVIDGYTEGKKGKVKFRTPNFRPALASAAENEAAFALDKEFQGWLKSYFNRRTADQPEPPQDDEDETNYSDTGTEAHGGLTDDDIPF